VAVAVEEAQPLELPRGLRERADVGEPLGVPDAQWAPLLEWLPVALFA
jgi:hypothetical protein